MKDKWTPSNIIHFPKSHISHKKTRLAIEKRISAFLDYSNAGDFLALVRITERLHEQGKEREYLSMLFLMQLLIEFKNTTISENNRKMLADELLALSKITGVYNEEGHFYYVCHVMLCNKTGYDEALRITKDELSLKS